MTAMEGDVMNREQWGLYAVALAVLVVGLVVLGVPASTLFVAALVLACPLMMIFMMHGMHGMHGGTEATADGTGPPKTTTSPPPTGDSPRRRSP
jgi:heme O synthase-like polyprenyltransferase